MNQPTGTRSTVTLDPRQAEPAPDPLTLPRLLPGDADPGLEAHFARLGPMPGGSPWVIDEVDAAGLRGRGGGGFPTAAKMRAVAGARQCVVVANGTEGEPTSSKDKALLAGSPHLVLDGISIAAETVGASEAILCVDRAASAAIRAVEAAVAERRQVFADRVPVRIETTPSRYVAGEESALVHFLNGGDARPVFVPPRPFERGVRRRPTLVNNVETFAHLALIARFGADWFRSLGTDADPGTALVTVSGAVARPGVYEVPMGIALGEVLRVAGGHGNAQAVLAGGYAGRWIPGAAVAALPLDPTSLKRVGATFGCGAVAVLGAESCGLAETARVAWWMSGESAGQCGPCVHGLPAIAGALDALVAGDRGRKAERQVRRWLEMVEGRGACHHPDGVAGFVRSALDVFAAEIEHHRRHGPCRPSAGVLPTGRSAGGWR